MRILVADATGEANAIDAELNGVINTGDAGGELTAEAEWLA